MFGVKDGILLAVDEVEKLSQQPQCTYSIPVDLRNMFRDESQLLLLIVVVLVVVVVIVVVVVGRYCQQTQQKGTKSTYTYR